MLAIAFEVMREPMFLLLVGCGSLYLLMGELSDALMLLAFVFVVISITIIQERRTERALDALRDLSSPRAPWLFAMASSGVSPGARWFGVIKFCSQKAIRVPADAVLRYTLNGLTVDESLLTGESVPVHQIKL